ncbi:DUF4442 domain-containing protein [Bowmanella yangjiangensis]|uniref:DUF4442 domain-containing protein n=1 Tax=Bowmanella yangjiangensis TaxID=2811230 RepID=A0ABS3CW42_9ALTE|nr:DUF4442 domain-containing protein [Bowmanella yangjiangensis]MBN7820739.1 DUF4442 domain-containing protein [Bowmanella yangjiangensis]
MPASNPLRRLVDKANGYPRWLSKRILTWAFCHKVKLAGTAGLEILETDGRTVTMRQRNLKKAQNHIGSVHAAAMALLAESASGFIFGVNLPGDKLPLIKSMQIRYLTRAQGDMQAVASITDEQIQAMQTQERGDTLIAVAVTDSTGAQTIECEMRWAWVTKKPH